MSAESVLEAIASHRGGKRAGSGYIVKCPSHDDEHPSCSLSIGNDGKFLACCRAGCSQPEVFKSFINIAQDLGLYDSGVSLGMWGRNGNGHAALSIPSANSKKKFVAEYLYCDENENLVVKKTRLLNADGSKTFSLSRPSPDGNGWIYTRVLDGLVPPLYNYKKVIEVVERDGVIAVVEGEKDADTVSSLELPNVVATTTINTSSWDSTYTHVLTGANVRIFEDNDPTGRKRTLKLIQELEGKAKSLRIIRFTDMPEHGDVTDYLQQFPRDSWRERFLERAKQSLNVAEARKAIEEEIAVSISEETSKKSTADRSDDWDDPIPLTSVLRPVPGFSIECLPTPFQPWLNDVAYRMGCKIDYLAVTLLVELGSIIGTRCGVRPKQKDSWTEVPNLWGAIIAEPGSKKTPAMSEILQPIKALQRNQNEIFQEAFSEYNLRKEVYDEAKKQILKKTKTQELNLKEFSELTVPLLPIRRVFYTEDSTVAKLGEILKDNPQGLLINRDELVGLFASWEQRGNESDRQFYLQGWNGKDPYSVERIGRGSIPIARLCISLFGSMQPDRIAKYLRETRNLANDGLMARLQLVTYPDESAPSYIDQEPNIHAKEIADRIIGKLSEVDLTAVGAEVPAGGGIPFIRFEAEASQLFEQFCKDLDDRQRAETDPLMRQHLSKYHGLMAKLALIIHIVECLENSKRGPITKRSATKAAALCQYLEEHIRRVYAMPTTNDDIALNRITERISKRKIPNPFTARDIYRNASGVLTDRKILNAALDTLESYHWLIKEPRGGNKLPVYTINPKVWACSDD